MCTRARSASTCIAPGFFIPNLLVAEFFIRNLHRRMALPRAIRWPAVAALAVFGGIFVYAIVAVSATFSGKYGKHLLGLFWPGA